MKTKINNILANARQEIANVIADFFKEQKTSEIEFKRYVCLSDTQEYETIKRMKIRNGVVYVFFPNYKPEYAWKRVSDLPITQLQKLCKYLENWA
jgi:hypothetical protein